jgi:hypothetical protein
MAFLGVTRNATRQNRHSRVVMRTRLFGEADWQIGSDRAVCNDGGNDFGEGKWGPSFLVVGGRLFGDRFEKACVESRSLVIRRWM